MDHGSPVKVDQRVARRVKAIEWRISYSDEKLKEDNKSAENAHKNGIPPRTKMAVPSI